jgi:hypothetical protein
MRFGGVLKKPEEVMEVLEAYDLATTLARGGGAGRVSFQDCRALGSVRERAADSRRARRHRPAVGDFAEKIEELVERSGALSERTWRREAGCARLSGLVADDAAVGR